MSDNFVTFINLFSLTIIPIKTFENHPVSSIGSKINISSSPSSDAGMIAKGPGGGVEGTTLVCCSASFSLGSSPFFGFLLRRLRRCLISGSG